MSNSKIGNKAELLECSNERKNRYPNAKVKIANGRVSRSGSLLEVSPSRFRPFLLLKNEPVISPSSAVNPRNVPIANATKNSFVDDRADCSQPEIGLMKILLVELEIFT